jgi:hypothetical protein
VFAILPPVLFPGRAGLYQVQVNITGVQVAADVFFHYQHFPAGTVHTKNEPFKHFLAGEIKAVFLGGLVQVLEHTLPFAAFLALVKKEKKDKRQEHKAENQ